MNLRSNLSKVKGLGPAKEGSHHWIMQRVTALALAVLVVWFICNLFRAVDAPGGIFHFLASPYYAIGLALLLVTAVYHGCLGMRVVIEDYVNCVCVRFAMIWAINIISIILVSAALLGIIKIHVNSGDLQKYHDKKVHKIVSSKNFQ